MEFITLVPLQELLDTHLLLFLEFMEVMLELADISQTLLALFMLQSVKQSQDISMEDMDMVLDMPVLDMLVLDILDMGLVFIMDSILAFTPAVMLSWLKFHSNKCFLQIANNLILNDFNQRFPS